MNKRKTIISVVSILLALVLIAGAIAYGTSPGRRTCSVYPVSDIAMTNYWGDEKSTYGEVRADKVQTVYLSSTQQVNDVFVTEGQSVLPGDKLMSYDTTLSEMEVTRKDLEIQQMKEELTAAKKRYNTLAGSKVYSVSAPAIQRNAVRLTAPANPAYRLVLLAGTVTEDGHVEDYAKHSGSGTADDPYLYVCANGVPYGDDFMREIGLLPDPDEGEPSEDEPDPAPVYVVFGVSEDNLLEGTILQAGGSCFTRRGDDISFIVFDASDYIGRPFGEAKPVIDRSALEKAIEDAENLDRSPYTDDSVNALKAVIAMAKQTNANSSASQAEIDAAAAAVNAVVKGMEKKSNEGGNTPKPDPTPSTPADKSGLNSAIEKAGKVNKSLYTDKSVKALDAALSLAKTIQGKSDATQTEVNGAVAALNAVVSAMQTKTSNNGSNNNNNSNNSSSSNSGKNSGTNVTPNNNGSSVTPNNNGKSYAEIQAEKAELQQKIKDLDLKLRMAEVELKRMNQELTDGVVYAEMAGTITSVVSEDEARSLGEPVIKLAGGGGYQVQGTVDELDYDSVFVGQGVEVTSWESGQTYHGTVLEISDIPTDSAMVYGGGNMNVSYYPFLVRIEGEANLREYETLEIKLETEHEQTDAFYLEQPFVLQENGHNYVYLANEDGQLEKREITTGITLWGSSIQILDGVTLDDNIAFPYGKNAREGAKTKLATLDELYMG